MIQLLLSSLLMLNSVTFAASLKADLALDWKPEPEFGGFYEASLGKLYTNEGLDITILPGGAGQPVSQMVAAKKVKFGVAAANDVIESRAHGAKVVALFAVYQNDPMGIMVHSERNIGSLKELFQSDGTIATQKGLPYMAWLEKKFSPFKAKVVPYTGGIATFLHDKNFAQQCFITSEPVAAKREGANAKTFLVSESGYNPYLTVVITHEDTLKNEPDAVKKFVSAARQGWKQYLNDSKKTNIEMQKLNSGMDLATFDEAARLQLSFIETAETKKNGLGWMSEARWKSLYDQLVELKLVKSGLDSKQFFQNL